MSTKVSVVQSPVYQDGGDDSWKTAEFGHRSSKIVDAVRTTEDKYDPYTSTSWKSSLDEDKTL